jgi:hypothetical protein
MPHLHAFEEDRQAVVADLRAGRFDYLEVASRVTEARFFRYLLEEGDLEGLAATYPTPRKKEEVPLWLYLASQITMRLHGQQAYSSFPYIVHCGGLRDALGPSQLTVEEAPEQRRLLCKGYNKKNHYKRRTPCDQDFLRKLGKDTDPDRLLAWFNGPVVRYLTDFGAYDEEGVFLLDGSYLFVPDNPAYEGSSKLRFDDHPHPVSKKDYDEMSKEAQDRTQLRRCYQGVFLLHLDRRGRTYAFGGLSLLPGKDSETPEMGPMIDRFVAAAGRGVMKMLIFDRGFLDGKTITRLKKKHRVDCLFPLKKGMLDLADAWVLAEHDGQPWSTWTPPEPSPKEQPPQRPEPVRRREEARQRTLAARKAEEEREKPPKPYLVKVELKAIADMELWETLEVPLTVVLMRDHMSDGTIAPWALATTRTDLAPEEVREWYHERTQAEERHRQLKLFWDLSDFPSRALSLIRTQVVFILLAYSLFQAFLKKRDRGELNERTRKRIVNELTYEDDKVVLYSRHKVAYLTPLEHQELLLTLGEGPKRKILEKTRELRRRRLLPEHPERPAD